MKLSGGVISLVALLLSFTTANAQYLQFAENKGQWDSKVTFASDMGGMAFFLQKQGYKVLLNDSNDLRKIEDYYGGHTIKKNDRDGDDPHNGGQVDPGSVHSLPGSGNNTSVPILGLHRHAYEVTFPGSDPNPVIVPDKAIDTYNNYYLGNDRSKWASHCRIFQALTYKNIYPNIDVRYYTNDGVLKYDIIVNPGGDIGKIALRFDGVDGLSLKNGNLIVKTSVGNITELSPIAYQVNDNIRSNVDAKFVISGNTVYFRTGNFSKTSALVIDPTLIFSSLTKSTTDNWGYTATYDNDGSFYAGGIIFGNGYPTANGPSFQPNFTTSTSPDGSNIGGHDVAIIKLSSYGTSKLFATYLGGSGIEQPHSMVVNNNGELIVAGRTTSTNFPVTANPYGPCGKFDIFITKFTADGSNLVASRRIGGSGDDGVNVAPKEMPASPMTIRRNYGDDARSEVITDASGNIYLASCTQSTDNSLATANAFQANYGGGLQDGLLIKADPDLNVIFCSYLGGTGVDAAFVLALNPVDNDIYVGGATTSQDLAHTDVNSSGILHTTYQGGQSDGFVTVVSNDGKTQRRTAYVGTAGNDMVYGVQFDKFGYPYIMGTTSVSFPVTGNVGFTAQAKGRQFITKLSKGISGVEYSTNFGKTVPSPPEPDISPIAFLVDRCENVYVSGWGGGINQLDGYPNAGTTGLTVTAKNPNDIIQKVTDGKDFYFFVLEKNAASQLYGTFFGELPIKGQQTLGDHVDGGTSRFDKNGIIYQAICANCGKSPAFTGTGFPTTGSVWGPKNISTTPSYCNEAAVKIAFELAGVSANLRATINGVPRDTSGCIPMTVDFADTIARAKQYIWDFGDGSALVNTTSSTQSHTYTQIGNYQVRLIAIDSESCNISDTVYAHIRARSDFAQLGFTSKKLPPCDSLNYQFVNTSVPPPNKPFGAQSFQWDFGDGTKLVTNTAGPILHDYAAPGTYTVILRLTDTNYCNSPDADSIKLRIATNVKAQFNILPGCAPYNAVVSNTSLGGEQFSWDFGDGSTSTENDPVHLYQNPGTYIVRMTAVDSNTCNKIDSTTRTVVVGPKPTAGFTFTPVPPQEDVPTTYFNNSDGGTHYAWDFGDGNSLSTISKDTPVVHQFEATATFNTCLVVYNDYGCADTSCHDVDAVVRTLVDVPNAFTPNGDGVNEQVHVRGFGITKMNWMIYNRWGVLVFQSSSPNDGWDGYYKGVLQPQEVYSYVLDVTFFDGTKVRKKGDITLLR